MTDFTAVISTFAEAVRRRFAGTVQGQPEEQLKTPVETLLNDAGMESGLSVRMVPESAVTDVGGRPDFAIESEEALNGHIELKQPGTGASHKKFRGHNREQWQRFRLLPNLVYTDGNSWALYRTGERVGQSVYLGDVCSEGPSVLSQERIESLGRLLHDFLTWKPIVPNTPHGLAKTLAPLCRWVRDDVLEALEDEDSALSQVARDWRQVLFPEADDPQFADAYAQTLTYALLIARLDGAESLDAHTAATTLRSDHGLLGEALRLLAHPLARQELQVGVNLLERIIGAISPDGLAGENPWLYFYEDFLAEYDPKLRRDRGVYYTPKEVVGCQVNLVDDLLCTDFDKPLSFADDQVVTLDPAAGTGTYPLRCISRGLSRVEERFGPGGAQSRAHVLGENIHAFELLVGPYAVAHLRVSQAIHDAGGSFPADGARVLLTDTLESPRATSPGGLPLPLRELGREHERAQDVKANRRVLVCMGNPPYDRQTIERGDTEEERKGGWIRFGDEGTDGLLADFVEPARAAGAGRHVKNLYNDYVYFWRWALWKVLDQPDGPGIVSFISAASYLRGPGFVGMRGALRQRCDELYILDLEGDQLGPRKTENVFAIRTPVAIAVGVRYGNPQPDKLAACWYTKLTGTTDEKLAALDAIGSRDDVTWQPCMTGWGDPLVPQTEGAYFDWPAVTDLLPWQSNGVQMKRTWPIAPTPELLERRWHRLVTSSQSERIELFRPTRDRNLGSTPEDLHRPGKRLLPLNTVTKDEPVPPIRRYAYHSLNRAWLLADSRLGDFMRPALWRTHSEQQVYLTSLLTTVLGEGPAAMVAAYPPDLHHFRTSYGGKDAIPLWRDASATTPNLASGVQAELAGVLGRPLQDHELFCYAYALLSAPTYTERFSEELSLPGPRLPITRDEQLFTAAVGHGRELIRLHTYNERFTDRSRPLTGAVRCQQAVSHEPDHYPETFEYDEGEQTLHVGDGVFAPVTPEVMDFSVSGYEVVHGWLSYRLLDRGGRSSTPLDAMTPERWTAQMTEELLELLWVVEQTIASHPKLDELLDQVVAGKVLTTADLPSPTEPDRQPLTAAEQPFDID